MTKGFFKSRVLNVLEKYGYNIREITSLDKTKTIYIANTKTGRVETAITGSTWSDISEQVSYQLAMFGRF